MQELFKMPWARWTVPNQRPWTLIRRCLQWEGPTSEVLAKEMLLVADVQDLTGEAHSQKLEKRSQNQTVGKANVVAWVGWID